MKNVLAFGGGRDSTALLALHLNREKFPNLPLEKCLRQLDAVVFSDTGAEFPETYKNVHVAQTQCDFEGLPFHVVKKKGESITEWVLRLGIVPLMPGGSHVCSRKFKGEVMEKWARETYENERVRWLIGIEANEGKRARRFQADSQSLTSYPLIEMGLVREDLTAILELAWTIEVRKSSCFFCPFMQAEEIEDVRDNYPKLWKITKNIEKTFQNTSPVRYQAWLDAGKPVDTAGRALRGMWKKDSWAAGARLFARRREGKQITCEEWENQWT